MGNLARPVSRARLPSMLATACAAGMLLAACGSTSPAASTNAATRPPATATTPVVTSSHTATSSTTKPPPPPAKSTPKPAAAAPATINPRLRAALTQFRTCMRENGVTLPEPGAKPTSQPRAASKTPQFKAAAAKCRAPLIAALKAHPAGAG